MRGGRRKGAGRPLGIDNKERVTIRLPVWLKSWLREQPESQAVLIEKALINLIEKEKMEITDYPS